jgi:hypothetical protein
VFIAVGGIQIVATALIMLCAIRYKDMPCPVHLPRRPAAMTAPVTGTSGNEPGPRRPAGRPDAGSAGPAGHGGALRRLAPTLAGRAGAGPAPNLKRPT